MSPGSQPARIEPEYHNKIWGSPHIEPWFRPRGDQLTGEVWFPAGDLLVKFLFTTQNLSVQVHPGDDYARKHENSRGKTEMWHILRADPGARIALGFREPISADLLVSSAQSGEIVDLLNWIDVSPGDTYFVPAGTVHAIGAGIALCEIQQNSDITYRLFDYHRGRPLHLRQAAEVAELGRHDGKAPQTDSDNGVVGLVECPYFRTRRACLNQALSFEEGTCARIIVVLRGAGLINGLPVSPGEVLTSSGRCACRMEPANSPSSALLDLLMID